MFRNYTVRLLDAETGMPTCCNEVHMMTNKVSNSNLLVLGARPAQGKSLFALSVAKYFAIDHNIPTAYFSLQMSEKQLLTRFVSQISQIDYSKIYDDKLKTCEKGSYEATLNTLKDAPLHVDDTLGLKLSEFSSRVHRFVKENDVKLVIIDYIQLMSVDATMNLSSRQEEIVMLMYRPEYYGISVDEDGNSLRGIAYIIVAK